MNQDILEDGGNITVEKKEPAVKSPKTKWYMLGLVLILVAGGILYLKFSFFAKPEPVSTPTPSPTIEAWKIKTEKNVTDFLDLWQLSLSNPNSDQYALKAKDLLTNIAQAKLATYKDDKGNPITKLSAQLSKFITVSGAPKSYEVISSEKIDERTVEVKTNLKYNEMQVLIFTNTLEGDTWLINSVAPKGSQKLTPTPSPLSS